MSKEGQDDDKEKIEMERIRKDRSKEARKRGNKAGQEEDRK